MCVGGEAAVCKSAWESKDLLGSQALPLGGRKTDLSFRLHQALTTDELLILASCLKTQQSEDSKMASLCLKEKKI